MRNILNMRKTFILLILLTHFRTDLFCQTIPEAYLHKIDSLFASYNTQDAPGYAVGVVNGNQLIYTKGFGMSNLEFNAPITPKTNFNLASVSKQFTAYSILLLAEQGKLNLDDDIRKYLDWFPNLNQKITIRHLLDHTSGIREHLKLLSISGTTGSDYISQTRIIKMLGRQEGLNFIPGEKYSYCNSGYIMLAQIVERISKQTFREYIDSVLFMPLGMSNTFVHDEASELLKNYADSYEKENGKYYRYIYSNSTYGSTGLYSNIEDLSKWIINFFNPKVGSANTIKEFTKPSTFNDGIQNRYAAGLFIKEYKGKKVYWHSGADAGYRTFLAIFPESQLGIIILANDAAANPWTKTYQIADLLLKDKLQLKQYPADPPQEEPIINSSELVGNYITESGLTFTIKQNKENLYANLDGEAKLTRISKDTYAFGDDPDIKVIVQRVTKDSITILANPDVSRFEQYRKYTIKNNFTEQQLKYYVGTYYCKELDCIYKIYLKDGKLMFIHYRYSNSEISFIDDKEALTTMPAMTHIKFTFNKREVTGFEVNSNQIMHLRFIKIK